MISGVGTSPTVLSGPVARDRAAPSRTPAEQRASGDPKPSDDQRPSGETRGGKPLTTDQLQLIRELQSMDRNVRAHESAHKAVGGSLAGSVSLSYTTGPDGRRYASGGEVSIDSGAERDPQATIAKMARVIAAALAPADPSPQDQAVAAQAQSTMSAAQAQLMQQQRTDSTTSDTGSGDEAKAGAAAKGYAFPANASGGILDLIA